MEFFDGKAESVELEKEIVQKINGIKAGGKGLKTLLIVQIGDNPVSEKYIGLKVKLCEKLGIPVQVHKISEHLPDATIISGVKALFESKEVNSGIIQLPLPRESLHDILDNIPVQKDVDMISNESQKHFYEGDISRLSPVLWGVNIFLRKNEIDIRNKKVTVLGCGYLVGRPVARYLQEQGSFVEIVDAYTTGTPINADLVVLSAGIPNLVKGDDVSKGCHVIDFGSSIVDGRTVGDFDLMSQIDHLGIVSPSPGGMGPLVVRFLIMNHILTHL